MRFFFLCFKKTQKHPYALYDKFIKQFVLENSKNYSEIAPYELMQVLKHHNVFNASLYKYHLFLLLYKTYIPILWESKTDIILGKAPTALGTTPPSTTAGLYFKPTNEHTYIDTNEHTNIKHKIGFNVGTYNFELEVQLITSNLLKPLKYICVQYNIPADIVDDYLKRVWGTSVTTYDTNMPESFYHVSNETSIYYYDDKDVFECINNHLKYFFYLCVKQNVFPEIPENNVAINNLIDEYKYIINNIQAEAPAEVEVEVEVPAEVEAEVSAPEAKQFWTEYYLSTSIMQKLIQTEKIQTILQIIRTNQYTNISTAITLSPFTKHLYDLYNAMIDIDRPPETNPIEYIQNPEIAEGGKIKTYKYQKGAGGPASKVVAAYEVANKHKVALATTALKTATIALNAATTADSATAVKVAIAKVAAAKVAIAKVATAKDTATAKVATTAKIATTAKFDVIEYINDLGEKVEAFKTVEELEALKTAVESLKTKLEANSEAYTEKDREIINGALNGNTNLVLEAALIYYYHIQFTHSQIEPVKIRNTYAVDETTLNEFVNAIRAFKNAKYAVKTALINTIQVKKAQVEEVSGKPSLNFIFPSGNNIEYELTHNVQEGGSNKYQILYYKYVVQRKQAS